MILSGSIKRISISIFYKMGPWKSFYSSHSLPFKKITKRELIAKGVYLTWLFRVYRYSIGCKVGNCDKISSEVN